MKSDENSLNRQRILNKIDVLRDHLDEATAAGDSGNVDIILGQIENLCDQLDQAIRNDEDKIAYKNIEH